MINRYSQSSNDDASLRLCGLMLLDALVQVLLAFCMLFLSGLKLVSAGVTLTLALFSLLLWLVGQWAKGFEQVEIELRELQSSVRRWK